MFYNLRNKINYFRFNRAAKAILQTPSVTYESGSPVVCVSQVCHRDILMYLVAIKSFVRFVIPRKVYVLDDTSLKEEDKKIIREQIGNVEIIPITHIGNKKCPIGGCWERLLFISDCAKDSYIIQLDSDTLTAKDVTEVAESVRDNRSFTLATWVGQQIEPMKEACQNVKSSKSSHVQIVSEKNFDRIPGYERLKYIRGCAAFAGFAKGSFSREEVEEFSLMMNKIIGTVWPNWGSEQLTSNYIVANCPSAMALPYPKYAGFNPERSYKESSFLHFMGTYRFKNSVYMEMAKDAIRGLRGY